MRKWLLFAPAFCLCVVSLNTHAASGADISSLVNSSRSEAQAEIAKKIQSNNELVKQITLLESQIETTKKDIATNRHDMKRDLYIAGGSAVALVLSNIILRRVPAITEGASYMKDLYAMGAFIVGSSMTVDTLVLGGYNYLLVHVDESKLPALERNLTQLKDRLQKETAELSKQ